MQNTTQKISVNGWSNLRAALFTADPTFNALHAKRLIIQNLSATPATVHFNDTATQPADATDGLSIGAGAVTTAIGNSLDVENVDLTGVWINTAGAQDIIVAVLGY